MAGIDTSIYNALLQKPKTVAEYDNEAMQGKTNALALQMGQQKADEYTRSVADNNRLRQVVSGFGDDTAANANMLLKAGRLTEAQNYQKSVAEAQAKTADVGKTKQETLKMQTEAAAHQFEIAGQLASAWATNPGITKAQIQAGLAAAAHSGVISPEITQAKMTELAGLPEDPKSLNQWATGTLQQVMKAKDSMSYIAPDAGQVLSAKTQVDTNAATNATSRANTASNNAVQMRGQNMTDARTREAASAGKIPAGYRANADGTMSAIPGGPADPNTGGGKMTEDQGKATGWLVQAENAYKNMMTVGVDKKGNPTSAAKPGINDAIAAVPGMANVANSLRSADRQKFIQASSSLSESLLRAATGAGVNKDEAKQKVEELTPLFGESPEVTKQKYAAIPLYIESLKVRAGPGAKKAAGVLGGASAGAIPSGWSVKEH